MRLATPNNGFCVNETGVVLLSSGLLSPSEPSGSEPFTEPSVTVVPPGDVPVAVAVLENDV